jgi:hypothetical protein
VLGVRLDASVGIEGTDRAVTFLQDLAAFFEEGLDGVDEFLLVEFFFRLALGSVDCLYVC